MAKIQGSAHISIDFPKSGVGPAEQKKRKTEAEMVSRWRKTMHDDFPDVMRELKDFDDWDLHYAWKSKTWPCDPYMGIISVCCKMPLEHNDGVTRCSECGLTPVESKQRQIRLEREANLAAKPEDALCVYCEHFDVDLGTPDWSDVTPGNLGFVHCRKQHFRYEHGEMGMKDFRKAIKTARDCLDWKAAKK